jgi:glycerol dehydrogenase-like iron-containing ADH family enzyme/GNAT superfamily N-acetyltransferase
MILDLNLSDPLDIRKGGCLGNNIVLRPIKKSDQRGLCCVCLATGNGGSDASTLYQDPMLLGKRWVIPYIEYESDLCFALEDITTGMVIAYALGCSNTKHFEAFMQEEYLPKIQKDYPNSSINETDCLYKDHEVISEFYSFRKAPSSISDNYPGHVHIDIMPMYQGMRLGRILFGYLLNSLRKKGCKAIHLEMAASNIRARRFYNRTGLHQLAVVDTISGEIMQSDTWKFDPMSKVRVHNDEDIYKNTDLLKEIEKEHHNRIVYMGTQLNGEDEVLRTTWNPLSVLTFGSSSFTDLRMSKSKVADNLANVVLVCTAPEPWELVKHLFPNTTTHVHMVTSMEEKVIKSTIAEYIDKGIVEVYGIGGGSACDYAKVASQDLSATLYLVPTILSVDAPFTRAAGVRVVMDGKTSVRYIGDASLTLKALVVDTSLLNAAPRILNVAGVGDVLSIVTALWDWRESAKRQGESYSEEIASLSLDTVNRLLVVGNEIGSGTNKGYLVLANCYADEVALCEQWGNSRPEEGSEHYLAYAIESTTGRGYIHGKLVGLCILIVTLLQDRADHIVSTSVSEADQYKFTSCVTAARLAKFYVDIGLACAPGSNGMPSVDEIIHALVGMNAFLKQENQLLPGYFHYHGAPSRNLANTLVQYVIEILTP